MFDKVLYTIRGKISCSYAMEVGHSASQSVAVCGKAVYADFLTCDRDTLSFTEQKTLILDEEEQV